MRIALVGYGKMGKEIEKIAKERGHCISIIIDQDNSEDMNSTSFKQADVAIEFTNPYSALNNINCCINSGVPVVCGSTGWLDHLPEISEYVKAQNGALFYASNFSLGVNIFFKVNQHLASIMSKFNDYSVEVEEWHHNQKLDSPSGTAITAAEGILESYTNKNGWINQSVNDSNKLGIISIRKGEIPGTHTVTYDSPVDKIVLTHEAKSREGFALGAVLAAEFLAGKTGVYTMSDLLAL
ncbi:4-hydroxy-tetrahydrodipicolinate reductase [Acetobacteroides hydrogenigenes]|uniref:4-hydroxy-tetrahydrodipicolinate reductase n=1 Tax=Acetobacteroides hydrogenigenes TaxID=979970 RepID=A0A4R2EHJ5_9BACT|nr:4-hydroxy-tetrahydrodipicolinate reductase [Acetobacteroides hydrogenigenes]TCN66686.1 4-hydroxy-tetrahydrodipicolinate reductase [Acetobacteroides hydrogenigenes]